MQNLCFLTLLFPPANCLDVAVFMIMGSKEINDLTTVNGRIIIGPSLCYRTRRLETGPADTKATYVMFIHLHNFVLTAG
jgi:hypothetical protein